MKIPSFKNILQINVMMVCRPLCRIFRKILRVDHIGLLVPVTIKLFCWSLGTEPLHDLGTNLLPCGNQPSYPVTNQVQCNYIWSLQIRPVGVPYVYAYTTETKNLESDKDSKISKIVPEIQKQDLDISWNNLKLVLNNKNNNIYEKSLAGLNIYISMLNYGI